MQYAKIRPVSTATDRCVHLTVIRQARAYASSEIGTRSSPHALKLPSSLGGLAVIRRLCARLLQGQGSFRRLQLTLVRSKKAMPPKKKSEGAEGPGPLLGRFGTSLKCGIVGLPNVG